MRTRAAQIIPISGRVVRAYRNLLESLPLFVAALFLVHAAHATGPLSTFGAWQFAVARILYVPAYAFGPTGVRPLCWIVAWLGVALIVAAVFV